MRASANNTGGKHQSLYIWVIQRSFHRAFGLTEYVKTGATATSASSISTLQGFSKEVASTTVSKADI